MLMPRKLKKLKASPTFLKASPTFHAAPLVTAGGGGIGADGALGGL